MASLGSFLRLLGMVVWSFGFPLLPDDASNLAAIVASVPAVDMDAAEEAPLLDASVSSPFSVPAGSSLLIPKLESQTPWWDNGYGRLIIRALISEWYSGTGIDSGKVSKRSVASEEKIGGSEIGGFGLSTYSTSAYFGVLCVRTPS